MRAGHWGEGSGSQGVGDRNWGPKKLGAGDLERELGSGNWGQGRGRELGRRELRPGHCGEGTVAQGAETKTLWGTGPFTYGRLQEAPNLLTVRFDLDTSLLVHQPLNNIHVTLTAAVLGEKEYTVDDLKASLWLALPW